MTEGQRSLDNLLESFLEVLLGPPLECLICLQSLLPKVIVVSCSTLQCIGSLTKPTSTSYKLKLQFEQGWWIFLFKLLQYKVSIIISHILYFWDMSMSTLFSRDHQSSLNCIFKFHQIIAAKIINCSRTGLSHLSKHKLKRNISQYMFLFRP